MSLVSDRVLNLAVQRVRRNVRIALDSRGHLSVDRAMELIAPVNDETMFVAVSSAQLILNADRIPAQRQASE